MSWVAWLGLGAGVLVFLASWRAVCRAEIEYEQEEITTGDLAALLLISLTLVWLGPFFVIARMSFWQRPADSVARVIAGESRAQKRERRERELRDRERRVAELERELGIG
jgi:hypothetical protein